MKFPQKDSSNYILNVTFLNLHVSFKYLYISIFSSLEAALYRDHFKELKTHFCET